MSTTASRGARRRAAGRPFPFGGLAGAAGRLALSGYRRAAKRILLAGVTVSALAALLAGGALAHARANRGRAAEAQSQLVLSWYDITNNTINAGAFPEPVTGSDIWSISWLAAAHAVRGPQNPSFVDAAFVQALHDTLVAEVPAQQSQLDSDLASSLAAIPNGKQKSDGIAAGQSSASAELGARQGDGLDTASLDIPYTPPPAGPGVWQPTPPAFAPAVRAGEGKGRAYVLAANDQFDPGPPPSLSSQLYKADLAEVRSVGAQDSGTRTAQQTDVALFWEPAANIQYIQIVRGLLAQSNRPLAWQTDFVAAFQAITTDAQIGIYNAKFKYAFWRPVTAIQQDASDPDPSWTPFFTTPKYPDWPSGYAGAAQAVLSRFVGPRASSPIAVTSPNDPGVTHYYSAWAPLTQEVVDARVWEGIHFGFSDEAGATLGERVGQYDLAHLSRLGL
jgi:hypothetical protein